MRQSATHLDRSNPRRAHAPIAAALLAACLCAASARAAESEGITIETGWPEMQLADPPLYTDTARTLTGTHVHSAAVPLHQSPIMERVARLPEYVASAPNYLTNPVPEYAAPQQAFSHITRHKPGFFQKLGATATWLPDGGEADNLGMTELDAFATVALPLPSRDWPLLVTPSFGATLLDGPIAPDLPGQLYDASLEMEWYPRFGRRAGAIISVQPGVYSDFEGEWQDDALRVTGEALFRYTWVEYEKEFVAGVAYLDRPDVNFLPVVGLIWTPNPRLTYELVFPRPRVGVRIDCADSYEDWFYVGGEFGGDVWSIERPGGVRDEFIYRDYRVMLGLERRRHGGAGRVLEIGYVFGREAEFDSGVGDFSPDSTVMIRGGVTF